MSPAAGVHYLTVAQAAVHMGVSRWTVYRWVEAGQIPAARMGRKIVIPRHRLDIHMDELAVKSMKRPA